MLHQTIVEPREIILVDRSLTIGYYEDAFLLIVVIKRMSANDGIQYGRVIVIGYLRTGQLEDNGGQMISLGIFVGCC